MLKDKSIIARIILMVSFFCLSIIPSLLSAGIVKSEIFLRSPVMEPHQIVIILGGYTPSGDPYKQMPSEFLEKWKLRDRLLWLRSDILIVNCGTSIYTIPDTKALAAYLGNKVFPGQEIVLIGVSTGVEGIIKVVPYFKNKVKKLICISGTYDLFSLDPKGREYKIHSVVLGAKPDVWKLNNPLSIMEKMDARGFPKIYAFSEEKSVYMQQLMILKKRCPKKIALKINVEPGKSYMHNWDFWSSESLVSAVMDNIN